MHIMQNASVQYLDTFPKECSADAEALLAKGLPVQSDDYQQVLHVLASAKMTILPYSPHMAEWHKRSVTMKSLN